LWPICVQAQAGYHAESAALSIGFEVVWYSWSSNWGADFYGGVRISLPDPASTSVIQGYWNYPNGTLAVDYPDVVLLKLLSRKLFPKAPEAYWMLRNFKIEPRELFELLGTTGTSSEAERLAAACQWLKTKHSRHFSADRACFFSGSQVARCFDAGSHSMFAFPLEAGHTRVLSVGSEMFQVAADFEPNLATRHFRLCGIDVGDELMLALLASWLHCSPSQNIIPPTAVPLRTLQHGHGQTIPRP